MVKRIPGLKKVRLIFHGLLNRTGRLKLVVTITLLKSGLSFQLSLRVPGLRKLM